MHQSFKPIVFLGKHVKRTRKVVNNIENFWRLLKRCIHGTYVSIEPFHLFRYLDEQSFRFNGRKMNDAERFVMALQRIVGKRLTHNNVTGKTVTEVTS